MIIEICVAVVSFTFVILSLFACIAILAMRKSLMQIQSDLNELTVKGTELISSVEELNDDLAKKVHSLDFIFKFLNTFNDKQSEKVAEEKKRIHKNSEKIAEIVDVIETGINLVRRIKGDINKYAK